MARHHWEPFEDEVLRQVYPDWPARLIAELFGLTITTIYKRAATLGLRKSDRFMSETTRARMASPTHGGHATKFKKGHASWNKGMKGLDIGGKETRFKRGERHGAAVGLWQPIGAEREVDGYLQRKVTDTGYAPRDYRPVHHLVWQAAGREIPVGHALVFRDGNRRNIDLDDARHQARHLIEILARPREHIEIVSDTPQTDTIEA